MQNVKAMTDLQISSTSKASKFREINDHVMKSFFMYADGSYVQDTSDWTTADLVAMAY